MDYVVRTKIAKLEDRPGGRLRVYGWASVARDESGAQVVDHQGDIIDDEELTSATEFLVKGRAAANVMHDGPDMGDLVEAMIFTPEKWAALGLPENKSVKLWVGYELTDPDLIAKVKSGELSEFSIEGSAERVAA